MICSIYLLDVGEDQWVYGVQYKDRKYYRPYPMPFEEMSPLEQERLIAEMFSEPFHQVRQEWLDTRPSDVLDDMIDDILGPDVDEDEPEER